MRWIDEVGLQRLVLAGDHEAFAELMRRFEPLVRAQLARAGGDVTERMAAFWCRRLGDLSGWNPDEGMLAQWLRRAS